MGRPLPVTEGVYYAGSDQKSRWLRRIGVPGAEGVVRRRSKGVTVDDQRHHASDTTVDANPLRQHEVELRVLADRESVPGVRTLAADMAMRKDFDLDAIEDLRLAVDEACALLITNCAENATLTCRLLVSPERVELSAFTALGDGLDPVIGPLSLRILQTLADSFDHWTTAEKDHRVFHVRFATTLPTVGSP